MVYRPKKRHSSNRSNALRWNRKRRPVTLRSKRAGATSAAAAVIDVLEALRVECEKTEIETKRRKNFKFQKIDLGTS